jgi:RNA polymerase sigma-70 factor (ECF subfamily)
MINLYKIRSTYPGDWPAFQRLAVQHQDFAYTLAYYLLGDEQAAASSVQSAFQVAYRESSSFRHGSFRGWLLQRVLAACLVRLAASSRKPARLPTVSSGVYVDLPRRLLALPVECRAVIILVDLLGMNYEEAAQVAGCSPRAVGFRLARARARMAGI